MAEYMTTKQAATLWGISERRVSILCREDRVDGVKKQGHAWMIPADAEKPADNRVKSGEYKKNVRPQNLPLPIGVSDYRLATSEYYYVDKTMMIKDFLDERPMVSLFTRPRRFGKTLNMDMLRTFFEKTGEDTSVYFKDKKIWSCGRKYRDYQGKYPVIFITLKDVKKDSWQETLDRLTELVVLEYKRHKELADSSVIQDGAYYKQMIDGTSPKNDLESSLFMLSKMLHEHHGIAPIIIIDEYDTPIQQGYMCGFYDKVILFMRNLFSGAFKDNRHLSYGFLTGILRVAKESIFSGLNNLVIHSVLDEKYSQYFGFTHGEVREMAEYYHADEKYEELCAWYDGYRFGQAEIFNPWSVINYFGNSCKPMPFWTSTGSNDIINEVLSLSDAETTDNLRKLLLGDVIKTRIDTSVIYPQIHKNPASIYSFLLMAGYLKPVGDRMLIGGSDFYAVAIPNKEISGVYRTEILEKLEPLIPQSTASAVQLAVYAGDAEALRQSLRKLLLQSASCFDTVGENFYHGLMLGLCATMEQYMVTSNRESGEGRYDICLRPRTGDLPGVLIELKAGKDSSEAALKELAQAALQQIEDRQYDMEMRSYGIRSIFKYGVAFSGKMVEVAVG